MNKSEALRTLNIKKIHPTIDEIQKAYKELVKIYHPDRHPSASQVIHDVIREKFERIQEAKNTLMSIIDKSSPQFSSNSKSHTQRNTGSYQRQSGMPPSGLWVDHERVVHEVKECQRFLERRQFDLALIHAENAQNEIPNDYELLTLKFEVLGHLERHHRIETECNEWEKHFPQLRQDFQHRLTLFTALRSQTKNNLALNVINDLIDRESEVPTLLGLKASTLIELGQGRKADLVIDRLKVIDPTHPLVKQRGNVMLVGDTYVDKSGAAQDACFICILLECLFDCL